MPPDMPPLPEACLEELRRRIALYGLGLVIDQIRNIEPHGRGRMRLSITEQRLQAMARHLAEDQDLPEGRGRVSELARRAIRDWPRPVDFDRDGSVKENAVKALVDQFDGFCFDLDSRGFDGPKSNWSKGLA
jgi:hypothetical protein